MKEKRDKEKSPTWREQIRQAVMEMEIPAYTVLDVPRIELVGDGRLLIERHHGLLEYSDDCIRIAAYGMAVKITGMDLRLQSMTRGEIAVAGHIAAVELQK